MDARDATAFEQYLWGAFPRELDGCDRAMGDLQRTLELLPEPASWMLSKDLPGVHLLGANDVLYTLTILASDGGEGNESTATLTSRPLDAERLTAAMQWRGSRARDGLLTHVTRWTFRYPDQRGVEDDALYDWQRIEGAVTCAASRAQDPEQLDHHETFARYLLSRLGQPPVSAGRQPPEGA